jgi:hypothetical protein
VTSPPPAAGDRLATLAARLARGGWPAAGLVAVAAAALMLAPLLPGATLWLPLVLAVNTAVVALLVLETGAAASARALALAALLLVPMLLVGGAPLAPMLPFAWVPALAAGGILRGARSLPLSVLALTAIAAGVVLAVELTGVTAGQSQTRAALLETFSRLDPKLPRAEIEASLGVMMQLAGGLLALVLLGAWNGGLFLGRSLQARLRRPGAFAQEFRALRFGRAYGWLLLPVVVAAFVLGLGAGGLAIELALVTAVPALLQGLALVHGETARRGWWPRLPWLVYVLLIVATPQIGALLVMLGLMDNWLDFRSRPLR